MGGGRHSNPNLHTNLFRDLFCIILNKVQIPQFRIESSAIDNSGFLKSINRSLTMEIQQLDNQKIPLNIDRETIYTDVESFIYEALSTFRGYLSTKVVSAISPIQSTVVKMDSIKYLL